MRQHAIPSSPLHSSGDLLSLLKMSDERTTKESKMFFIVCQVVNALSSAATLDDMVQLAMKLIFEVINADRGAVLVRTAGTQELKARLAYDRSKEVISADGILISGAVTSQVVQDKVSIIISDALQDPRFMQEPSIVENKIRSTLCVPFLEQGQVHGVIYVDNVTRPYAFSKDDLELLTAIASLIALRIKYEEP